MIFRTLFVSVAALGFALAPILARAETVEVLGFMRPQVQAFDATGKPEAAAIPTAKLPKTPFSSSLTGPAKSVGIPYEGRVVFVRRLDLKLGATACIKVAAAPVRGAGSMQAGDRMGAGDSTDCLVQ